MLLAFNHMCQESVLVMVERMMRVFPPFVYDVLFKTVSVIEDAEKLGTSVFI